MKIYDWTGLTPRFISVCYISLILVGLNIKVQILNIGRTNETNEIQILHQIHIKNITLEIRIQIILSNKIKMEIIIMRKYQSHAFTNEKIHSRTTTFRVMDSVISSYYKVHSGVRHTPMSASIGHNSVQMI